MIEGHSILLPPPEDACQVCASAHPDWMPHNQQSLYYQVWFLMRYGRSPTWHDAIEHCTPAMRARWIKALRERGVEV
jgi:hypothetical protein